MSSPRSNHTLTLLPTGKVLVAGGMGSSSSPLSSAQVYDPATGAWSATGAMGQSRYSHTATLLPNGKVLVVGGRASAAVGSTEVYDPATGTWSTTGRPFNPRYHHTATLLRDGRVLLAGGHGRIRHPGCRRRRLRLRSSAPPPRERR
jgi:hypothetical protein